MPAILKIDGRQFDFFNNAFIELQYASIESTFKFDALFDPDIPDHRKLFRPSTYKEVVLESVSGERLLTGTLLSHSFVGSTVQGLTALAGYSKTGVLTDCPIPANQYPLEFTDLTFEELAVRLCDPFGIKVVRGPLTEPAEEKFPKISAQSSQTIGQFLSETAAQKNLVLTHDPDGNLLIECFTEAIDPIALFEEGQPGTRISLSVNGQGMHSLVNVQKQASKTTKNVTEAEFENPFVPVFRPTVKKQSSGTSVNTLEAARNSVLNELKNSIKLIIETDRWEWVNNKPEIIRPNRLISVLAPKSFIFNQTNFFVEKVELRGDNVRQTATISCVLPEVFNGEEIKNIFQ